MASWKEENTLSNSYLEEAKKILSEHGDIWYNNGGLIFRSEEDIEHLMKVHDSLDDIDQFSYRCPNWLKIGDYEVVSKKGGEYFELVFHPYDDLLGSKYTYESYYLVKFNQKNPENKKYFSNICWTRDLTYAKMFKNEKSANNVKKWFEERLKEYEVLYNARVWEHKEELEG